MPRNADDGIARTPKPSKSAFPANQPTVPIPKNEARAEPIITLRVESSSSDRRGGAEGLRNIPVIGKRCVVTSTSFTEERYGHASLLHASTTVGRSCR